MNNLSNQKMTLSNVDIIKVKTKIEKYIGLFDSHKHQSIATDLRKLLNYCETIHNNTCDSIWIIK